MSDWKILVTDGLEEIGLTLLRAAGQVDDRRGIEMAELLQAIPVYEALVVRGRTKVTAEVIDAAERLKVIGRAGVGIDNIDLEAARARQIRVVNSPSATTQAVAELTLGLMLGLARSIPFADASMKSGYWVKRDLVGVELYGKNLGVVGMGHIGAAVARGAAALGMSVLGYDPMLSGEEISWRGARPVPLEELFSKADFVTLHIPLIPETRGFLGESAFRQMKDGVHILCTARGGIIDEEALLEVLESGKVAGAALDVYTQEPPGATALVSHPKVIATPHIGAQTQEAQARAAEDIAVEVLAALNGQALRWKVV
jgi:D-3-phosphoglycerate dehydrogenase